MVDPDKPLQSSRIEIDGPAGISLRQLTEADAHAYFQMLDRDRAHIEEMNPHVIWETEEDIRNVINGAEVRGVLKTGIYNEAGELVGGIDLFGFMGTQAQIGLVVDKDQRRQGYATKAVAAMKDYALNVLGKRHLVAKMRVDNEGSRKAFFNNDFRLAEINNKTGMLGYEIDLDSVKTRPVRVDVDLEIVKS